MNDRRGDQRDDRRRDQQGGHKNCQEQDPTKGYTHNSGWAYIGRDIRKYKELCQLSQGHIPSDHDELTGVAAQSIQADETRDHFLRGRCRRSSLSS
ncbi:hypothetical protein TIFTF001_032742 [Ficus carica]|uniref:Uncharacterized protein n=1 Tax=Ficus carica TaxID=3494 RepID=A0AA88J2N6_FICCA|nr:hypothetical protein TIFTF001_032637 [Ficus carica]GMN63667.1 hypothetical protein TIFTF001_032742 [Ficus carica]